MSNLGVLAEEAGDHETARSWWEKAAALGNSGAMFNLGLLARKAGDLDTARSWFEQAVAAGSEDAAAALADLDDSPPAG